MLNVLKYLIAVNGVVQSNIGHPVKFDFQVTNDFFFFLVYVSYNVWDQLLHNPWRRACQPIPVFLPGESPWTEEPIGLQSVGSQRVGHD